MTSTVRLVGPRQRDHAKQLIDTAPDGYVMRLGEETRNIQQNAALHGWVTALRKALPDTFGQFSMEDCKLRLMNALSNEMRYLPELEGGGMFLAGQRTRDLSKSQFANLLTIVDAYAARHGVELPRSPEFWDDNTA